MKTSLALPTVAQYERAMLEASGAYVVAGTFYRDHDRAAIARRRLAESWVAEDARRAAAIRRDMQAASTGAVYVPCH